MNKIIKNIIYAIIGLNLICVGGCSPRTVDVSSSHIETETNSDDTSNGEQSLENSEESLNQSEVSVKDIYGNEAADGTKAVLNMLNQWANEKGIPDFEFHLTNDNYIDEESGERYALIDFFVNTDYQFCVTPKHGRTYEDVDYIETTCTGTLTLNEWYDEVYVSTGGNPTEDYFNDQLAQRLAEETYASPILGASNINNILSRYMTLSQDSSLIGRWKSPDGASLTLNADATLSSQGFRFWQDELNSPDDVYWGVDSNGYLKLYALYVMDVHYEVKEWSDDIVLNLYLNNGSVYQKYYKWSDTDKDLIGVWKTEYGYELTLNADGSGSLGKNNIVWQADSTDNSFMYITIENNSYDYLTNGSALDIFTSNGIRSFVKVGN